MTNIGQQIFLATHTALDIYLGEKFKEYYRFKSKNDSAFTEANLRNVNLNSIDRIKKQYLTFLGIRINLFEVTYLNITENCGFKPQDSWEAIQIIYKERNNIVHKGRAENYEIILPPDAWYPFEFVCKWVQLFDANFDANVYKGQTFQLIREYEERKAKLEINGYST